jgi:hypothetical protein
MIEYKEGMEMKELVDAINQSNEAMMTGFNAMIQQQTDLLLGEIKKVQTQTDEKFDKLFKHLGIQE